MAQRISIVDYGMGNLRSVQKALAHVAPDDAVEITSDPEAIRRADRVVFPGQGAMPDCMRCLEESGLGAAVEEAARAKPFLGLCIGQQMLFEQSAEGPTPGLALLGGRVVVDFSGRPGLEFHVNFTRARVGEFDVDLTHEFFQGLVNHAMATVHVDNLRGDNSHHQCETVFKAFARALRMAVEADPKAAGAVPSTKGAL